MSRKMRTSRRTFLKATAAGAAGVAVGGVASKASAAASAWTNGMQINPQIDNLRVVSCRDSDMVNQDVPIMNFSSMSVQNGAAEASPIHANLDEMAKALAQEATASAAWAKIFQKPSAKQWSEVRAVVKVNCIAENHPRVAVVGKVCGVLNSVGIPFSNIIIYDGCHNAYPFYNSYIGNGLPPGIRVSDRNSLLGGTVSAPVPGRSNVNCTRDIANGTIDILVNCAVNKGHGDDYGRFTMCMKNHFGTFEPGPIHNYNSFIGINKSDAIVGGTPPRQQLCIIDSLWAGTGGPGGAPNRNVYRLVMGTFAPGVDFLTAKKVREPEMSVSHASTLNQFLPDFGYTTTERDNLLSLTPEQNDGKGWVEVAPASQVSGPGLAGGAAQGLRQFTVKVELAGRRPMSLAFNLPAHVRKPVVAFMDVTGRVVHTIDPGMTQNGSVAYWDGFERSGSRIASGTYVVRLSSGTFVQSRSVTLR